MDAAEQLRSQDASLFHRSGGSWIILCGPNDLQLEYMRITNSFPSHRLEN